MEHNDTGRVDAAVGGLRDALAGIVALRASIVDAADRIEASMRGGGKLLLCGNGGSSSQAQHIAAEFVNRFLRNRTALPAIALTTDQAILTSQANDAGFETVFERQVEALGRPGDVLLGLSTSGSSPNVLRAFASARARGLSTIGLTGRSGGRLAEISDLLLCVDSTCTPRIQEAHLLIGHLLAEIVEARF